ncbi:traC domain protein [Escherichia coli 2731150]|nr:traC domain protein [Escherichia coli 2762100]EMW76110.1 traC domain protein [Escherichia coli 2731150]EZA72923.1 traC domain protein [Escherichia coli O25:NM str. E2539C1]
MALKPLHKLTAIREHDKYQNSPGITNRLDEIIELLGKYCSWGIYGEYFNSDEPSLTDDARFIVLELGGLQDKPDLLVAGNRLI